MSRTHPVPNNCIEYNPSTHSVLFCGTFISLTAIAREANVSVSGLSMIFSGQRAPSLAMAIKISDALRMELREFVDGLYDHTSATTTPMGTIIDALTQLQSPK